MQETVIAQLADAIEACSLVGGSASTAAGVVCSATPVTPAPTCTIIITDIPKLNFGKNAALSGDGNWIAVSEDYMGAIFVYGRCAQL